MKLFQIEEPDGSPSDPDAPGAAIGIDAGGALAEVAYSVGGNALVLSDREGFERDLPVPGAEAPVEAWQTLFEGVRLRAERALARPVTHAVLALAAEPERAFGIRLHQAAMTAGVELLDIVAIAALGSDETAAEATAVRAEGLAPRPEAP
jgi:hypothetical protein